MRSSRVLEARQRADGVWIVPEAEWCPRDPKSTFVFRVDSTLWPAISRLAAGNPDFTIRGI